MAEETKSGNIFDNPIEELSTLFEPTKTEGLDNQPTKAPKSMFKENSDDDDDEDEDEVEEKIEEKAVAEEKEDDEDDKAEDKAPAKKTPGRPKKATVYGEGIKALIDADTDFMIYQGDDDKVDYTKEEYIELFNENIRAKSEAMTEATITNILKTLSPTAQKLVTGELKGVKIADVIKDLEYYVDVESIPEDPTDAQKEKIVKAYYSKLAKERKKDSEWVTKQVEKVIDKGDLDSEFEDAKEMILEELDKSLKLKEKEKEELAKQKKAFREYNAYYTNEALKEDNIFGIKLSKEEKSKVANILATFQVRPSDNKEKLGITAMIDSLIHSENPKEAYKRLALMALAGTTPDQLIERLRSSAEKKEALKTEKILKVAPKNITQNAPPERRETPRKSGSIF